MVLRIMVFLGLHSPTTSTEPIHVKDHTMWIWYIVAVLITAGMLAVGTRFAKASSTSYDKAPYIAAMIVIPLMATGSITASMFAHTSYSEFLNGEITKKTRDIVACRHEYPCNCRTVTSCSGSGKDRTCSSRQVCDTCHEHAFDVDWNLHNNVVHPLTIPTIDRQGLLMPKRWEAAHVGDPFAATHTYTDWIKSSNQSLYSKADLEKSKDLLQKFPYPHLHDGYLVDRTIDPENLLSDKPQLDRSIGEILKELGPKKEANLIIVLSRTLTDSQIELIMNSWEGGAKNDITIFLTSNVENIIVSAKVFALSVSDSYQVQMRDALINKPLEREVVISTIRDVTMSTFTRKSMKEFEYLKDEITPPWYGILAYILILISGTIGFFALAPRFLNSSHTNWSRTRRSY